MVKALVNPHNGDCSSPRADRMLFASLVTVDARPTPLADGQDRRPRPSPRSPRREQRTLDLTMARARPGRDRTTRRGGGSLLRVAVAARRSWALRWSEPTVQRQPATVLPSAC